MTLTVLLQGDSLLAAAAALQADRDAHELQVSVAVPHEQLGALHDVLARLVADLAVALKQPDPRLRHSQPRAYTLASEPQPVPGHSERQSPNTSKNHYKATRRKHPDTNSAVGGEAVILRGDFNAATRAKRD